MSSSLIEVNKICLEVTAMERFGNKKMEMNPKNFIPIVKHGSGNMMVIGSLGEAGIFKLVFEGILNHCNTC